MYCLAPAPACCRSDDLPMGCICAHTASCPSGGKWVLLLPSGVGAPWTPQNLEAMNPECQAVRAMLARAEDEKDSRPSAHPVQKTATGMSALSIWMKDTLRNR